MKLTRLRLTDFRNVAGADLVPHPRFNVLHGDNGQGKTNLLEAIYWLATLRPLRARRLRELVRWDTQRCRVEGTVEVEGLEHALAVGCEDNERVARRENKPVKASQYFGALAVVLFTPDDAGLVRAAPEERRRFLDRAIFTGRPAHLGDVVAFRRALEARNHLLRENGPVDVLAAYEGALARSGARLVEARATYLASLGPRFQAALAAIGGGMPAVELSYRAAVDPVPGEVEGALAALWADSRDADRRRGFTQRGPHVDDLVFRFADRSARAFASQGQQRAIVLALKIAEIELLADDHQVRPVLLLDDVSSELDADRNTRLFEFLEGFEGQVFITTTDADYLRLGAAHRVWRVAAGGLTEEEG